jgi:hypothetical protein
LTERLERPYSALCKAERSLGWFELPERHERSGVSSSVIRRPKAGKSAPDEEHAMTNNESVADDKFPPDVPAPQASGPQIAVASDEDWKNRVKAEDAALDQRFRSQPAATGGSAEPARTAEPTGSATQREARPAEPQTAREMPKPTFGDLIGLLSAQAIMFLGLIPNPATQKAETQLPTARYFIDLISILEEKTAGQLTKEESHILDESLHSLRLTYMQRSKQTA